MNVEGKDALYLMKLDGPSVCDSVLDGNNPSM